MEFTKQRMEIVKYSDDLTVSSWCLSTFVEDACIPREGFVVVQIGGVDRARSRPSNCCA